MAKKTNGECVAAALIPFTTQEIETILSEFELFIHKKTRDTSYEFRKVPSSDNRESHGVMRTSAEANLGHVLIGFIRAKVVDNKVVNTFEDARDKAVLWEAAEVLGQILCTSNLDRESVPEHLKKYLKEQSRKGPIAKFFDWVK
jgi:hypothetical protein